MLPIKDRIIKSRLQTVSERTISASVGRPQKYKEWTDERMAKALHAVKEKRMPIREAALRFDVPKSTLGDRVSGRVQHGAVSGPPKYLISYEEDELSRFLIKCANIGFPKTRQEVLVLVDNIIASKGISHKVTNGWWEAFCHRHPEITLRTAAPLSKARCTATDPDIVNSYFDLLEATLEKAVLEDKPGQIFNMHETGMSLDPKSLKCVTERGTKNVLAPSSGDKSQITIIGCVSASGVSMPPLVVLKGKSIPAYFTDGEVPETRYGLSVNGWSDQQIFHGWFKEHFLRYAPSVRPLLLLMDGHSSHYCPETIKLAASERVILFVLPPNTTHLLQPLDKGSFGPLKMFWRQECHKFMAENPGQYVNRYCFSKIFSKAWANCMTVSNVKASFKTTGIFPLNRNAVEVPSPETENLAQQSDLPFIPLYTAGLESLSLK